MDFQVGAWLARPGTNCVVRKGRAHHVTPKAMDVLVCLAKRHGEVVLKAEIFQEVWAGAFVSDDALTRCIVELRRVFRETAQQPAIIETVAKRGYRIAAPVSWGSGTPIQSIAVLPLMNLSGDAGQEYFADGMTEILTSNLSKLGKLRVISRTSAMTYKGSRKPLCAIARELNVDALVEGSVLRLGKRVRIVAQLIDGSTDAHLWAETYERDFEDVLRLEADLAEGIARQIKVAVSNEENACLAYQPRIKPEAYEAYLKGMFHLSKFTGEGFHQGISYLEQAATKDPADPFAHASLALGYCIMGHDRFPDALVRGKTAALKSLELGGPLAEAYLALGMAELYSDWDLPSAGQELQRALELKPNLAEARRNYSWYLRLIERPQEGLAEMKRAEELEPLVPLFPADLAWQYFEEGQLDAAMAEARKSIELNPNFAEGLTVAGWVCAEWGHLDEALGEHLKAAAADTAWSWPLGRTYALMGRGDDARRIAAELGKAPGAMDQWGLAVIYTALGEKDEAFRWLVAAEHSRFSWMPWIFDFSRRNSDLFTPLRGDRRFEDLIRRIGVPEAHRPTDAGNVIGLSSSRIELTPKH
jgi:TolB-like protein/Tfp pilus assembly protein PilF